MHGFRVKQPVRQRQLRRKRHHPAWIFGDAGKAATECLVSNLSRDGAMLVVGPATEIGPSFDLSFALTIPKRRCEVVWRSGRRLGIRFVDSV